MFYMYIQYNIYIFIAIPHTGIFKRLSGKKSNEKRM